MRSITLILAITLAPFFSFAQDYYRCIYEAESSARNEQLEDAIHYYQKAMSLAPLQAEDAYNLSCLYSKRKDSANAVKYFQSALNQGFGNADWIQGASGLQYLRSLSNWNQLWQEARQNDDKLMEKFNQKEAADNYDIHTVFTSGQLQQDVALLRKALEEAHPGLYWYTSKKSFDSAWNVLLKQCEHPQNITSFYYQLWKTINLCKDVHSETTLPKAVNQQFLSQGHFFPVPIKYVDQHCYINLKEGTPLPFHFGDEVLSLDGHPVREIKNRLYELILADGYALTGKQRVLNRLFYKLYTLAYQPGKTIEVTYKTSAGKLRTALVETIAKTGVDSLYKYRYLELADTVAGRFYYAEQIPVLKINTFNSDNFSSSHINYYHFLDSAFSDIKTKKAAQLIIDLRQNNGGNEQLLQELLGYLLDKPWQPYRSAHVQTRSFSFLAHTDDEFTETSNRIKVEFQPDSTGKLVRKADWAQFSAVKANRFSGKLIVLIGGLDVSAGSSFPSLLYQNRPNTVFVGEETGGGFYGNNSSYYLTLTLPNTRIHCKIPLVQLRLNVQGMPFGHGLQPQYPIQESIEDLKTGNDPAFAKAIELARQ